MMCFWNEGLVYVSVLFDLIMYEKASLDITARHYIVAQNGALEQISSALHSFPFKQI